ncbi:hypothetical protein M885DRAFT_510087 [Pelagophyceae sp. CCMP2097]|nr:hypothetical protein M885DRAFT_510087 [Pelagophyceae sp. CCMP2097]
MAAEGGENLREKLATYADQLFQVEGLLQADPQNDQFQKLRQDLRDVIKLTEDLIKFQHDQGAAAAEAAERTQADGDAYLARYQVGMRVEAFFATEEKWFPAVITAIAEDHQSYTVVYIGFGNAETIDSDRVRPLLCDDLLDAMKIVVGYECRGRFSGDGKYYDCVVSGVTDFGYKVTFTAYGNAEELPLEYLRQGTADARAATEVTREDDGSYRIPEHLRLQSTDTDADKLRKRRKVKALKQKVKTKEQDEARDSSRNSWQSFNTKGAKRKVPGTMKAMPGRKESIFASPTSVDGKVGVTGSGSGVTEFGVRQKFKLNAQGGPMSR